MSPRVRKLALGAHLVFADGWIGAVIVYLALGVAASSTADTQIVRAAWIAMELTGWFVIVPLALASLLTGLLMALGTSWGLFRHYWVLFSLLLTIFATVVLLLHMPDVTMLADAARAAPLEGAEAADRVARLGSGDLLHPALGLVVLLTIQVLNVYKPAGLTPYGRRRSAT
jgi:uncharacterized membrane protein